MHGSATLFDDPLQNDLVPRAKHEPDSEFDITAMIDLVFMMNIYFLIGFIGLSLSEFDLPSANHCSALDAEVATIISVAVDSDGLSAVVYLGDGKEGEPLHDPEEQQQRIAGAVEQAVQEGRTAVLLKAEKNVRLREIARISGAATREGVTLHMAVMEKDDAP
jgi:biopolymer transport protein ExbD